MADDDARAFAIAARIADGSAIDWADASASGHGNVDAETLDELKAIEALATLHRAPTQWDSTGGTDAGARWGPLTLIEVIGEGAFGRVYRAWDAKLHRLVALKLMREAQLPGSPAAARALEEARLLARVRHHHVLTIHGAESFDGQTGIWTEYIEGETLEAIVAKSGPLAPDEVIRIGVDLAGALAAVHRTGLLHRDIKAANVMRETGGRTVLMDFGAGRDLQKAPPLAGDLSGTPLYLAPEIYAGGAATLATDLYALGVLLYYLATGTYPINGETLDDVRAGHARGSAARMRVAQPTLPRALADVIDRALAPSPAIRFSSADAIGAALDKASAPSRRSARNTRLAAIATVVLMVLPGVWWLTKQSTSSPLPASAPQEWSLRLPQTTMGQVARGGRYISFVDRQGTLSVFDSLRGTSQPVTNAREDGRIGASALSPVADRVAYAFKHADGAEELRIIDVDGTKPRALIARQTAFTAVPIQWSRDGTEILCRFEQRNGDREFAIVNVASGESRPLAAAVGKTPLNASLSPDSRFVVFDDFSTVSSGDARDVFIAGVETERRILVGGTTNDFFPMFAPDGNGVVFARIDPMTKLADLWFIGVSEGEPTGEPRRLLEDAGTVLDRARVGSFALALTDDGTLYNANFGRSSEVYIVNVDERGTPSGPPRRVSAETTGGHVAPSWSPDGEAVAYITMRQGNQAGPDLRTLRVQDHWPGTERRLLPALSLLQGYVPSWSPDGRSLIVAGQDAEQRWGLFRVDVNTSRTEAVLFRKTNDINFFQVLGDFLYYSGPTIGIIRRDLNGREDVIIPPSEPVFHFRISPNGDRIAYVRNKCTEGSDCQELVVWDFTGKKRVLVSADTKEWLAPQDWTRDGVAFLYTRSSNDKGPDTPDMLYRVAAKGGLPEAIGLSVVGNRTVPLSMHPAGRKLIYTEREIRLDLLVKEGFLQGARR